MRADADVDITHAFITQREQLRAHLDTLRESLCESLASGATLWICWPTKAARVRATVTEDFTRDVALSRGWVDMEVCAVNDVWSGLKLVVRKEHRRRGVACHVARGLVRSGLRSLIRTSRARDEAAPSAS